MSRQITVLGLESSCDETAAAIVRMQCNDNGQPIGRGEILSNCVYSQIDLHAPFGGVVPEIAARAHINHMDELVAQALREADLPLSAMDGIAATAGPGLIGGVLIGLTTGKALALAASKPFIGINHLEGHALTARLTHQISFPYLLLLVSGGHCQLLAVTDIGQYKVMGGTIDDAVGEAFDKAAKLMSLGYPGGPEIEQWATKGDATAFALPRPLIDRPDMPFDFSFSGLKTALRQQAEKLAPLTESHIADLAASFQQAAIDCLSDRTTNAMRAFAQDLAQDHKGADQNQAPILVVAGGVAANQALRQALDALTAANGFQLCVPPAALCTDNAAMIAWAGAERMARTIRMAGAETADNADNAGGLAQKAHARWPLAALSDV